MRTKEETTVHLEIVPGFIERYFVIDWKDILGSGISGHIRSCTEISTRKQFALKILHDNPRARQEVCIHQQLSGHPHIVSLHSVYQYSISLSEAGMPGPHLLFVMEKMKGGSLVNWLKKKEINEETVTKYMRQMVDALKNVHGQGIAHRDIKPDNFLLSDDTEDAIVKLADFGFAKKDKGDLKSPLYTTRYAASEVLHVETINRTREDYEMESYYDKSCDMWSLGVTMYCMLCGYLPFFNDENARGNYSMCMRILDGAYQFPSEEWDTISKDAKNIVQRLLQKDLRKRMTVQELADHPWLRRTQSVASRGVSPCSPIVVSGEESVTEADEQREMEIPRQGLTERKTVINSTVSPYSPVTDTDEEGVVETDEQSVTDTDEESVTRNDEQSVTDTDEETVTGTDEQSVTDTDEETVTGTYEQSVTDTDEESVTRTDEQSVTDTDEENVTRTDEQSVTDTDEETVTGTYEQSVTDTDEESVTRTDEQSVTDTDEENVTRTDEQSVTDTDEETVTGTYEQSVTDTDEESVTRNDEQSVTDTDEETVTGTDEQSVTDTDEESVTRTDEQSVTDTDEENVIRTDEQSVTDTDEENVTRTDEQSVTDTDEENVTKTDEQSVTDTDEENVTRTYEQSVTDTDEESVTRNDEQSVTDTDEETVTGTYEQSVTDTDEESVTRTDEQSVTDTDEETVTGTDEQSVTDTDEETVTGTDEQSVTDNDEEIENVTGLDEENEMEVPRQGMTEKKTYIAAYSSSSPSSVIMASDEESVTEVQSSSEVCADYRSVQLFVQSHCAAMETDYGDPVDVADLSTYQVSALALCNGRRQSDKENCFQHLIGTGAFLKSMDEADNPLLNKRKRRHSVSNGNLRENITPSGKKTHN